MTFSNVSSTCGLKCLKIWRAFITRARPRSHDVTSFSLLKEKLDDVLTSISQRERKILEMRFGLVDGYGYTLEEIGKIYNVTRERIRQIEAKALRKLRHPTRIHHLQGFLESKEE